MIIGKDTSDNNHSSQYDTQVQLKHQSQRSQPQQMGGKNIGGQYHCLLAEPQFQSTNTKVHCSIRPCASYIPLLLSQLISLKLILSSYQLLGFASGHFPASFFNKILYSFYFPHPYFCVLLCIVHFVSFCVLFVCKCVLYYCHQVTTHLQLTNISNTKPCITFIRPNSTR